MVTAKLISRLRCPIDGTTLELAGESIVNRVNLAIEAGEARDRQDQKVSEKIDAGLVDAGGKRLYPVRQGIPTLIADQAIELG